MTTTEIKQDLKIIYDRECDRIYRIAMVYLRNVCDAEDAVQAVFVKLLEKPQCFEDEEHEKAWFILVTKNYCRIYCGHRGENGSIWGIYRSVHRRK